MNEKTHNTCPSGKNTYETEEDAKRAVRDNLVFKEIKLNYYFCMYCFNYHLTSKDYSRKRK